jgi:hypothetical protein
MLPRSIACLTLLLALVASSRVEAGGEEPWGPDERPQARRFAATLRQPDGLDRAFRILCGKEWSQDFRFQVAFEVLVERAVAAMPRLLNALVPEAVGGEAAWTCFENAKRVAATAVCEGKADTHLEVDRRSEEAVLRSRAGAQRAVLDALARSGRPRAGALEVLFTVDAPLTRCREGAELLRRATPALTRVLSAKEHASGILRLFADGHVDPSIAVPAARPYLADPTHRNLAALALARMGDDVSAAVPTLAEGLDGPESDIVLDALQAIGPGARGALPRLATLSRRLDATCKKPVEVRQLIETVMAIATRADDADDAAAILSPLVSTCLDFHPIVHALGKLGSDGQKALLVHLRNHDNNLWLRLAAAKLLPRGLFDGPDLEVLRLLEARAALVAKRSRHDVQAAQVTPPSPPYDPFQTADKHMSLCRAEGGLTPVAVTGVTADQATELARCFGRYLCGPSRPILVRTLDRCCGQVFGAQKPAFCRS